LKARFEIDVRVHTEAIGVDAEARTVALRELETGREYDLSYDHLVLSPGANPFLPPIPGIEHARTLRNIEDVDVIAEDASSATHAIIVGAGFIGLELAENLRHRGIQVTVLELGPQVLAPLDPEMAVLVANELTINAVDVRLGTTLSEIRPSESPDHRFDTTLSDGTQLSADLVVMSIGVRPSTALAEMAGAELGPVGGIVVDDELRTSVPGVFAVGDATEKRDAVLDAPALVPLANVANRQGRRVADVIAGQARPAAPSQGTAIVKIFDLVVASTGVNQKRLEAADRRYLAIHTHPGSHAGYYPGAQIMSLKLLVDPDDGTILGAQAVGQDGVDKRIDVIATAIATGLPAPGLADLELAYAPPFGSAKDPINILGYIAENRLTGGIQAVQWNQPLDDYQIVDVREPKEFDRGYIPGALSIPLNSLRDRLGELDRDRPVLVYCEVGLRGHTAQSFLVASGYDVVALDGGMKTWRTMHTPELPTASTCSTC
jgi:NADPH-dependent 2,4-dienoyl-CoA reductase/sulfur reductase-like enzyme/rhodanese-related sulfurtransferase